MTLLERLFAGANSNSTGNALFREAAERIYDLERSLREILPQVPREDAICHNGLCPQAQCGYCGRVMRAHALLRPAEGVRSDG